MSARYSIVPAAAALDLTLSASELRVLIVLGTFLDRDNKAFPSQTTLAEASGVRRETTNRALKKLAELGYITSTKQTRSGFKTVSLYRVIMDPDLYKKPPEHDVTSGSQRCDPQITPDVTSRDHIEQPHSLTTTIIKDEPLSAKDWFEEFEKVLSFNDFPNLASGWSAKSHQWMDKFDLHKDCIPVIERLIKGKPRGSIHSWGYFEQAIADHQLNRLKPIPEGNNNDKPNNYSNSKQRKGTVERTIDLLERGGDLPDIF